MQKQISPAAGSHRVLALAAAAGLSVVLAACGGGKSETASQPAAKVNKGEVTIQQINAVLAVQRVKPEVGEAVSRQILERLIEQELIVQKAAELKIDTDPKVLQQIEAARRDVITRAYADHVSQNIAKPTDAEIAKFYADKPALFAERKIYTMQELVIEAAPPVVEALRARLAAAKTLSEFLEHLRSQQIRFNINQAVRPAEQVPPGMLDTLSRLKDGQSLVMPVASGLQVLYLQASRSQPLDEARARPLIELILGNQRKAELAAKEMKALREAAKIEYVGKFAEKLPGAASAPVEAAPLLAPSASESGK
ncbi:EpsD family peptidyl-prolyl cis-trans isomerase [Pelomonas sp. V22]|uniref:EpsD family peptidyl-prolyl cis-trans isomerase n=1 Tax=Pelomonas sp. V22 TaxID=2822139 RepID=UPI0024A9022B|nr:EpsD family peptidyl-prolyl cis-trans isomerase [Pelomonas sp. V22]MDI4633979.1 EpsD family peptidyl-prolyl cis-trans isomerase [Pelomonas sp. V22]